MLWFEDEIIVLLGTQQSHQLASVVTLCTMLNSAPKIGFPPAEVVIDINHRDAGLLRASFKSQELLRHRPCVSEQLICFRKIEIIDYVDQEQRDFVLSGALSCRSTFFPGIDFYVRYDTALLTRLRSQTVRC